jgi:outer membrane biosynthesis protein TonB
MSNPSSAPRVPSSASVKRIIAYIVLGALLAAGLLVYLYWDWEPGASGGGGGTNAMDGVQRHPSLMQEMDRIQKEEEAKASQAAKPKESPASAPPGAPAQPPPPVPPPSVPPKPPPPSR